MKTVFQGYQAVLSKKRPDVSASPAEAIFSGGIRLWFCSPLTGNITAVKDSTVDLEKDGRSEMG